MLLMFTSKPDGIKLLLLIICKLTPTHNWRNDAGYLHDTEELRKTSTMLYC